MSASIRQVIDAIESEKLVLERQAFFTWLADPSDNDGDKLRFIPGMYAYVMGFRDLLQLIQGPEDGGLQSSVNAYIGEDASHFEWYLKDLSTAELQIHDPLRQWDQRLLPSRRAIYRMIAYALDHSDPILRIILVMIFEATGEVFLRHTRQLVRRLGLDEKLGYFGTLHYEDEVGHSVHMDALAQNPLTDDQLHTALRMVREAFREYRGLFQSWREAAEFPEGSLDLFVGVRQVLHDRQV